jgi:hypothetical protein
VIYILYRLIHFPHYEINNRTYYPSKRELFNREAVVAPELFANVIIADENEEFS